MREKILKGLVGLGPTPNFDLRASHLINVALTQRAHNIASHKSTSIRNEKHICGIVKHVKG